MNFPDVGIAIINELQRRGRWSHGNDAASTAKNEIRCMRPGPLGPLYLVKGIPQTLAVVAKAAKDVGDSWTSTQPNSYRSKPQRSAPPRRRQRESVKDAVTRVLRKKRLEQEAKRAAIAGIVERLVHQVVPPSITSEAAVPRAVAAAANPAEFTDHTAASAPVSASSAPAVLHAEACGNAVAHAVGAKRADEECLAVRDARSGLVSAVATGNAKAVVRPSNGTAAAAAAVVLPLPRATAAAAAASLGRSSNYMPGDDLDRSYVECSACKTWRVLPPSVDVKSLPDDTWICSDATWCSPWISSEARYGSCDCSTSQEAYLAICAVPLSPREIAESSGGGGGGNMNVEEEQATLRPPLADVDRESSSSQRKRRQMQRKQHTPEFEEPSTSTHDQAVEVIASRSASSLMMLTSAGTAVLPQHKELAHIGAQTGRKQKPRYQRRRRCTQQGVDAVLCAGCALPDCGKCTACLDMPKFGGMNARRKACLKRVCTNRSKASETSRFANEHGVSVYGGASAAPSVHDAQNVLVAGSEKRSSRFAANTYEKSLGSAKRGDRSETTTHTEKEKAKLHSRVEVGVYDNEEEAARARDAYVLRHDLDLPLNLPQQRGRTYGLSSNALLPSAENTHSNGAEDDAWIAFAVEKANEMSGGMLRDFAATNNIQHEINSKMRLPRQQRNTTRASSSMLHQRARCNCKRNKCETNHCACYKLGVACGPKCTCQNCLNLSVTGGSTTSLTACAVHQSPLHERATPEPPAAVRFVASAAADTSALSVMSVSAAPVPLSAPVPTVMPAPEAPAQTMKRAATTASELVVGPPVQAQHQKLAGGGAAWLEAARRVATHEVAGCESTVEVIPDNTIWELCTVTRRRRSVEGAGEFCDLTIFGKAGTDQHHNIPARFVRVRKGFNIEALPPLPKPNAAAAPDVQRVPLAANVCKPAREATSVNAAGAAEVKATRQHATEPLTPLLQPPPGASTASAGGVTLRRRSVYVGVYPAPEQLKGEQQQWRAEVHEDGDVYLIGTYSNELEAAQAYDAYDHADDALQEQILCAGDTGPLASAILLKPPGRKSKTSKYRGVSWDKTRQKWMAEIRVDHKNHKLGAFIDEVNAARAYGELFSFFISCSCMTLKTSLF